MNQAYDESLKKIDFYGKYHPEYMPFIGERYDEFKILHVGESHFIPQKNGEKDAFPITYFEKWWTDTCFYLKNYTDTNSEGHKWGGWFNTRSVVADYLAGYRTRSHGIFTEMVKVFSQVCQKRTIVSITTEESQNYHYFSFVNFFQMPALYEGMKYWDSLREAAVNFGMAREQAKLYAEQIWEKTIQESSDILDQVIDILHPDIIIFTSRSAWDAYIGKHKEAPNIITTVHPGCAYWHKPKEEHIGKERLIQEWAKLLKNSKTT